MTTPHKHAALIKAWADGALIQYHSVTDGWINATNPSWGPSSEYRIKPQNVVSWVAVWPYGYLAAGTCRAKHEVKMHYPLVSKVLRIEMSPTGELVSATTESLHA